MQCATVLGSCSWTPPPQPMGVWPMQGTRCWKSAVATRLEPSSKPPARRDRPRRIDRARESPGAPARVEPPISFGARMKYAIA